MTKEEAIKEIKSWDFLEGKEIEAIHTLIPELAESEDERIRKELLEEIEFIIPHDDETDSEGLILPSYRTRIKRYKSYLEKQKEQTEDLSTRLNGVMQEYVKAGKDEEEQEHRLKCYQLFWDALGDSEFFKQKEQKPEWSEEDKYILKNIHDFVKENTINPNRVNCAKECLNWLNSLPERFNIQSKQEWREEDERMIGFITNPQYNSDMVNLLIGELQAIAKNNETPKQYDAEISWLKSLRLNLKKKNEDVAKLCSNEWSEEDEKCIKDIIICLEYLEREDTERQRNGDRNVNPKRYDGMIAKLKSLRPKPHTVSIKDATKFGNLEYERGVKDGIQHEKNHQWKPSEEQMETFKDIFGDFEGCPIMKSLYEDLKKSYGTC